MSILINQLNKISTFIYILVFLLVFNLFFNLNYDWYGVSFIIRSYLFVFSFYLIFIYANIKVRPLMDLYSEKYGRKGKFLLFLELRAMPFLIIYLITIIFTLIDYIRMPDWPFNPVLSLLNGRYSNLVIYSLFLHFMLKIKKGPGVTIPLFILVSVLYFLADKLIYSVYLGSQVITVFKFMKVLILMFLLLYGFFYKIVRFYKVFLVSLILSLILLTLIFSMFFAVFHSSGNREFHKKETGLILLRMGFPQPINQLNEMVLVNNDTDLLLNLFSFTGNFNIDMKYSDEEWEKLIFSGSVEVADMISYYLSDKNITLPYSKIIDFAMTKSKKKGSRLAEAVYFNKLAAKYIFKNKKDFLKLMHSSNEEYKLWSFAVMAEMGNIEFIPVLLSYLTDIDANLSEGAYAALEKITGLSPKENQNKRINDPDVYIIFKNYYSNNRTRN